MHKRRGIVLSMWLGIGLLVAALLLPAAVGAQAAGWLPGPNAAGDASSYTGFIDVPAGGATVPASGFTVAGWFVDKTAEGWAGADDVQVWLGTMDGGGKMLAKANFAQTRPDVASALGNPFWANSGFGATIPSGAVPAGSQTLNVYAHTPGKGWWYKPVTVNVSASAPAAAAATPAPGASTSSGFPVVGITRPTDGEKVLTKNDYEIIGYAYDPAAKPNQGVAGTGINRVQVYMGAREDNGTYLGDATLGYSDATGAAAGFPSAGWRLTFKPTLFHANTYLLYAYARSAVTGKEESTQRFFQIREN